ncbi:hypothetical protein CRE_30553 [Caenorhabditis remanei]|uniref:F-box associated domain-containing protein n=1 Tax=Caenorhabditis remanei TaxID=31234 RepID=E3NMQ7_CAERE|nr:hypothetical protein CRE_30553 [Caenorhabditis remanei]
MSSPFPILRLPGVVLCDVFKSLSIGENVRVISTPKGITTLGKNHREAFLSVIRHLLKMFQCKISTTISSTTISDLYQPTTAMLFDLRMKFKTIIIDLYGSEDRILFVYVALQLRFGITLLGNKDLEEILKNWKAGGFLNLKYLYIGSQNITNNGELILGINWRELNGMVIQTDDGSKKAIIKTYAQSIEMSVTPIT